jgi:predicted O-methyltransferase YrrM
MLPPPIPDDPGRHKPAAWGRAPLMRVLLAQAVGAFFAFLGAFSAAAWFGLSAPLFLVLVTQGVIAARLGERLFRLPRWWIPIQMVMPPAAALLSGLDVPAWIYLAAFVVLALIFWNAAGSRVPLYLTNKTTETALATLLPAKPAARFIDLGHGFGATVLMLAKVRPDMIVEGIESAPFPFLVSWARRLFANQANARIRYGDFWKHSLAPYDMVYVFLSPAPMSAIYDKARAEMQPGSLLVSNSFAVEGIEPSETRVLDDGRRTRLYLYRM